MTHKELIYILKKPYLDLFFSHLFFNFSNAQADFGRASNFMNFGKANIKKSRL